MSETAVRGANARSAAKAFPDAAEMARWNALGPAERRAEIEREEEAGARSGLAPIESVKDRLTRVRAGR